MSWREFDRLAARPRALPLRRVVGIVARPRGRERGAIGIFHHHHDGAERDGGPGPRPIPVILDGEAILEGLAEDTSPEALASLLRPCPDAALAAQENVVQIHQQNLAAPCISAGQQITEGLR